MPDLNKLEGEIDAERAHLTRTLDQLTDTLAPDRLATNLSSTVEDYGGEIGRQVVSVAKQNPAAVAMLAAGLGLLMTGGGTQRPTQGARPKANDPISAMQGFDERVAAADAEIKAGMSQDSAAPAASWLREQLEHGLDALPSGARRRVLKARRAAIAAQERVEARAADVARKARGFHSRQPLVLGALALGAGAIVGALLPSTRREDELLGRQRDIMMAKAQNALDRELAHIKGAVRDRAGVAANRMKAGMQSSGTTTP